MTPETLEALKGSIEKWRKIVEEGGEDRGQFNCPLCTLFLRGGYLDCPVDSAVDDSHCKSTPYRDDWEPLFFSVPDNAPWKADTDERMIAARAELDFLRGLLPKEEGP